MKKWNVSAKYEQGADVIRQLLNSRGVTTAQQVEEFLNTPDIKSYLKEFPKEFILSLKDAKELILDSINKNIPILIYGDYDADGVCATAIMYNTLKHELNYNNVFYFIPNRFKHGYGISDVSINDFLSMLQNELGLNSVPKDLLIITVDTGITAVDEISKLKELGYKVVLTDHHQKPQLLPPADVIVWSDEIVGSVVAWLLSRALGSKSIDNFALAGIATVTDVFDLVGINRSIVKKALEILNSNPPIGVKHLLDISNKRDSEVTTYDLGWVIGPRLNASGRLDDAEGALELLIETNNDKALELAKKVDSMNQQRQNKTVEMYELAGISDEDLVPSVIVSAHEDYHEGIIGLVASRLLRKYYRPSIVISIEGDVAKGSVRSISGIDIISILREFEELFLNLGGHPMAAGFSIETKKIEELQNNLLSYFEQNISEDLFVPVLNIDLEIPPYMLDLELLKEFDKLKPFGVGNSEPIFMSTKLKIVGINYMGRENNHVSLRLYDGEDFYKAIMFNALDHDLVPNLKEGDVVDIAYKAKINEFRGNTSVDFILEDLHISAK